MEKFDHDVLGAIQKRLDENEQGSLSHLATRTREGVRRVDEAIVKNAYRQAFALDADRILHSRAYTRYIDKTQVFYLIQNDHITHRVLHVQLASKIARTIGRFLGLNEDLIESIALGHDIGHTPFGHDGETFLSEMCAEAGIGHFLHNVQSVRFLDEVERHGRGWNLCLQTLDGILCHDGEVHSHHLFPEKGKSFESLAREMEQKTRDPKTPLLPMTLEGCVVRMSDTISYIGRDIEDAIRLGLFQRTDLPLECVETLGDTNGSIVHNLVTDIIETSSGQPQVGFSDCVSTALKNLKQFNMERIYLHPEVKRHTALLRKLFRLLFERYLEDLERENRDSVIYSRFLVGKDGVYRAKRSNPEIVRDFIAGMTDRYFLEQCPENLRPAMAIKP